MVDIPLVIAAAFCGLALLTNDTKKTILFIWLASLSVGVKHLLFGSDFIGTGIVFESSLFSYVLLLVTQGSREELKKVQVVKSVFSILFTGFFSAALFWVVYEKNGALFLGQESESISLHELSKRLLENHFLTGETLILLAFLILIGLGLNLRKEKNT